LRYDPEYDDEDQYMMEDEEAESSIAQEIRPVRNNR
jgi:hypothetical protein